MNSYREGSYMDSLLRDVKALGGKPPKRITNYTSLSLALIETTQGLSTRKLERFDADSLETGVGRYALELLQCRMLEGYKYTKHNVCPEAEPRLMQAMAPNAISNPNYKSPLIVTDEDGGPIGIIKRFGIKNLYGLRNSPQHHIFAQCFHSINTVTTDLGSYDNGTHVFEISADRIGASPVRLSVFAVPLEARKLLQDSTPALHYTHTRLFEHVYTELERARAST